MPRVSKTQAVGLTDKQFLFLSSQASKTLADKQAAVKTVYEDSVSASRLATLPHLRSLMKRKAALSAQIRKEIAKVNRKSDIQKAKNVAEHQKVMETLLFGTEAQAREAARRYK